MDVAPFRLAGSSHCLVAVYRASLEHTPIGPAALWHGLSGVTHDGCDPADYLQSAQTTRRSCRRARVEFERLSASLSSGRWNSATAVESFSPSWLQSIDAGVSPWLPWLTVAWLFGVFFLSLRLAGGLFYTQRLRRNRTFPIGAEWQQKLQRLCQQLQIRQTVVLLESARIQVPTVIGWLRPVILLPASTLTGLTAQQLEAVLAHELAHIRRYDYLVNLLQTAVETLLFYHPAVWWVSKQARLEREHCCDDLAVAVQGNTLAYARALAELETLRGGGPRFALAANGGSLLARIERLLGGSQSMKPQPGPWLPGVMVVASLLGLAAGTRSDVFFGQGGAVLPEAAEREIAQDFKEPLLEVDRLRTPDSTALREERSTLDGSRNCHSKSEDIHREGIRSNSSR